MGGQRHRTNKRKKLYCSLLINLYGYFFHSLLYFNLFTSNLYSNHYLIYLQIFFNSKWAKMRLIMLTENNSKLSCNHPILADSKFSFRATSDTVVNWVVPNTSNTKKHDSFAIAFKTHKQVRFILKSLII